MFQSLTREAIAALVQGDDGFREYLATLTEAERNLVASVFESPDILHNLLKLLPPDQQDVTHSLLNAIQDVPDRALKLFNQCRFFEARELLQKTIDLYELPSGLPLNGVIKAAGFVVVRVKALCYEMLGDVEAALGNTASAAEYFHTALELARQCGDQDTEAKVRKGLGVYYFQLGDYDQALEYSQGALDILLNRSDRWSTCVKTLSTMSQVYAELGHTDDAVECASQALQIAEEIGDERLLPPLLINQAAALTDMGLFAEVLPTLERALSIIIRHSMARQEVLARFNLGMYYLNTAEADADIAMALEQFREALAVSGGIDEISLKAMVHCGRAHALVMLDETSGAEAEYRTAAEMFHRISAIADEADVQVHLGNLLRFHSGTPEDALKCYVAAVELTEQLRSSLKRENHRIGLAGVRTEPYQQIVTTLIELGRYDEAFHYVERARSKALVELLAGQFTTDSGDEIIRQAVEIAQRIEELRQTLDEIQKAEESAAGCTVEQSSRRTSLRSDMQRGLELEQRKFGTLCDELQRVAPERLGMVSVQATECGEVQSLLTDDTALIELYQMADRLFLFVLRSRMPLQVVEIELTADDAADMVFSFVTALRDPANLDTRSHDFMRGVRQPASKLYTTLFNPLADLLADVRQHVIVPHLFWHYLPFHALYDTASKQYLFDRFAISYAPSATVLAICRGKNRSHRNRALILCRNDGDLPHVEEEGTAISRVFEQAMLLNGDEAVMERLNDSSRPDVIHCACHGYFNPEQPFLSGIAIPPDRSEDRPTLLMDIVQLKLDSSLITLSACDTGLNTISNADELVGLSRGFFGAGAAALLLSLWKVSDSSTAYLMENFYWHYVANRQSKGRALQLAMQAVRAKPEYAHPYYWAPFVVMGEWE